MTDTELNQVRKNWQLNAAKLARVLCVHTNKMSEYLSGVTRIPCAVAMHIEALQLLPITLRESLLEQRLKRRAHSQ
jgi:DNA-binding transcriptional regulator YdaS (Cro superfamily)